MPALIAVIREAKRQIHLDPWWNNGDTLECADGEQVRLLRTSQTGHLGEHAQIVASTLRRAGWKVTIRDCTDLRPRSLREANLCSYEDPHHAALVAAVEMVQSVGVVKTPRTDPFESFVVPTTPAPPKDRPSQLRFRCRVCGHITTGAGMASHVRNREHDDWERVRRHGDGTITPEQAQACPPEGSGEPLDAPDQQGGVTPYPTQGSESR